MSSRVNVSVVIPTYKRPDFLNHCLEALLRQQFPSKAYEIIVVDDGCSEETRLLVNSFSEQAGPSPRVRYVAALHTQGPAAARNIGWRRARGEIIAFTDDDCLPDPDWLEEGLTALTEDLAGVSGQVIVPIPDPPSDYEKNVSRLAGCQFVTANCFYRRSALEASGGFDEQFTMAWREDSDLQFKMLTCSFNLGCAPAARVVHPVRPAPWGVSLKEQRKSMFNALLFKKYPGLYRTLIEPRAPLRYYGIVFSTLGFLLGILAGNKTLAFVMLALWAGLILHFTFQRLSNTKHTPEHILEMLVTSVIIPYLSVFWRLYGAYTFRVFFF